MKTNLLSIAEAIATNAHMGQTRNDGSPYIEHPRRVASRMRDDDAKAVAWLHDVLEDSPTTPESMLMAGIPARIIDAVEAITKHPGDDYKAYLRRVSRNAIARDVKIADMLDNLSDSPSRNQTKRYAEGLAFLLDHEIATPPPTPARQGR